MPILIEIPDETIRQVQRSEYLLKNRDKTVNHEFRHESLNRLQYNIQEIVYAMIVKHIKDVPKITHKK